MITPVTQAAAVAASIAAPAQAKPKNAADAAKQFEALLLNQMLRNAHQSGSGGLGEEGGSTGDTMWDVAAQHFSQVLADNGGLGLATLITRSLNEPVL